MAVKSGPFNGAFSEIGKLRQASFDQSGSRALFFGNGILHLSLS
jgi:hypothetical protein